MFVTHTGAVRDAMTMARLWHSKTDVTALAVVHIDDETGGHRSYTESHACVPAGCCRIPQTN